MTKFIPCVFSALTLAASANPTDLVFSKFSENDLTPSPACIAASATGEVYVGVDLLGSLGKGPGKGSIVRLVDKDNDGKADSHTVFAKIDNPRGLIAFGKKVYVLHTIIPEDTKIVSGMNLSVLEDKDGDGVADGPAKPLVRNISVAKHNQDRGADHTTNGIRMGIDGWIYIAMGDFGIVNAEGTDGTKLTVLGGGVIRVRPDGSEMEVYTHGTRNIYDVAIDPFMDIFTRGNTNDGGGWNVRFIHHIQSGEYGYPVLFKNFTSEIIPALEDFGGGSGTGSLFMDEPTWPEKYNRVPMMADWGRNQVFIHRTTADAATFTQKAENFIGLSQPTDLDVDGSGRLYVAAWDGAGYKGSPERGFVDRVVPQDWTYKPFPDLTKLNLDALVKGLATASATTRLATQQEILSRGDKGAATAILALANDAKLSRESRAAAIFTYKQLLGAAANPALIELAKSDQVREFALRELTDRLPQLEGVPLEPFYAGLRSSDPRVQAVSAISLGRLGKKEAANALLAVANAPTVEISSKEGPHATPNPSIILPHLAVQALVRIKAVEACLAEIGGTHSNAALWALHLMHDPAVVDGLIAKYASVSDANLKNEILATLARLYTQEAPYDGSWWWNTQPDTRGPYYVPAEWEKSADIEKLFRSVWESANPAGKEFLTSIANRNRMNLQGIGEVEKTGNKKEKTIGEISIENVMLALDDIKGDAAKGKELMKTQACAACHNFAETDPKRGPDLHSVGARLNREAIAESILKPDAGIAESWVDVTLADGSVVQGTLAGKNDSEVTVRDIAGTPTVLKAADVKGIKPAASTLMGPHLLDALTMKQFADVIAYLHSLK